MTGYGIAETVFKSKKITVEIKTLNSKQMDLAVKVPSELRSMELDFRNAISTRLQRGKADVAISIVETDSGQNALIDGALAESYLKQIRQISEQLNIAPPVDMASLLFKMPGIFTAPEQDYDELLIEKINETITKALDIVDGFRIQEGATLKKDLLHRVELILGLLDQVEPYEKARHETIKQRLTKNLSDLTEEGKFDENRFEQELIFYLEKLDITEEKVRLRQHCNYFQDSCDEDQAGKKLGFISQEMGREINTLGSKANEVNIQRIVVQMKDELEKIKEQLCNIL